MTTTLEWTSDTELDGFETARFTATSGDKTYQATLIRDTNNEASAKQAVLYIHGLTDYFFQEHLARAYRTAGFAFYAIDLHGFGRSLQACERANYCNSVTDYYAELDIAISSIKQTGIKTLVLNGHSTGALLCALYADEGAQRGEIDALFLNSPFLDINAKGLLRLLAFTFAFVGKLLPFLSLKRSRPSPYARSVHKTFKGEWAYNLALKPAQGFPVYFGWINAIVCAQRKAQQGLTITCPILIMHSDRSIYSIKWAADFMCADSVLNVAHMRRYGPGLGKHVELVTIKGGMHDLVLSAKPVREKLFSELFHWLKRTL